MSIDKEEKNNLETNEFIKSKERKKRHVNESHNMEVSKKVMLDF